jgi:hypothetical protein
VHVGAVMEDWVMLLQACTPWRSMALDDLTGEFRLVLGELLEPGDDAPADVRAARLRCAARSHGAFRRRPGGPAFVLSEEIAFASEAIEIALIEAATPPAVIVAIQDSLAPAMRTIERAMYGGYVDVIERPHPMM